MGGNQAFNVRGFQRSSDVVQSVGELAGREPKLCPLEFTGSRCFFKRGLAHAIDC